jgi:molybdopterin molybdotransferase
MSHGRDSDPQGGRELPGWLPVGAARDAVLAGAEPLEPAEVPLRSATGRVCAAPVVTPSDSPPFDNSAMDGFAVRAVDCEAAAPGSPAGIPLVGESSAGTPWPGSLGPGEAIAISTGAEVPPGADAVVRVEDTERNGDSVFVRQRVEPGQNIRFRGEAMAAGTEVLSAGSRIGPVEIGLLASTGTDPVSCHRKPRVAIVATGDELVAPGEQRGPGQIWNSNLFVISSMVRAAGGEVVSATNSADTQADTESALGPALECDLAVICGGVSVGEHDHVKRTLSRLGVERVFWGLAIKPGRPAWFGTRENTRVLGLPGNPVSAMAVFAILGLPLLRRLGGERSSSGQSPLEAPGTGRLSSPVDRLPDRTLAVPCRRSDSSGEVVLDPIRTRGSHDFLALSGAAALALVDAGDGRAEAGDSVAMIDLPGE